MISAVILTLNEERNIVECIRALKTWCSDIVVFDSFSADRTVELARREGTRIFQRKFDNYAAQRNAALREVEYPGEWILMVDADELWEKELGDLIKQLVESPEHEKTDIIHFRRKDIFLGRWLKHNIGSGTWFGRLLRRDHVTVMRDINEEYHCSGEKVYIREQRFLHYPFSNGINRWVGRHNRYSDMEAARLQEERNRKIEWKALAGRDPVLRRKALKQVIYRIPCRPLWLFAVLYILKGGFLDGKAGLHYSVLRSFYEYMIDLKIKERNAIAEKNNIS